MLGGMGSRFGAWIGFKFVWEGKDLNFFWPGGNGVSGCGLGSFLGRLMIFMGLGKISTF